MINKGGELLSTQGRELLENMVESLSVKVGIILQKEAEKMESMALIKYIETQIILFQIYLPKIGINVESEHSSDLDATSIYMPKNAEPEITHLVLQNRINYLKFIHQELLEIFELIMEKSEASSTLMPIKNAMQNITAKELQ